MLDVHDEIYLVARIEKLLDGNSIHTSVQPYLLQMNDSNKLKAAIKLNKKMHQLAKTKLVDYRQPFAWAAKPIYRRKKSFMRNLSPLDVFELDKDAKFCVYEQDAQHLCDEDLYKYLADFRSKEKYLNKLIQISGISLNIELNDCLAMEFCEKNNKNMFLNKSSSK